MNKPIAEISVREESEVYRAERLVEEVCDYYHVGNEYFANVMLGTTEAIRMVLKRRKVTGEYVTITAIKTNKGLQLSINGRSSERKNTKTEDPLDQAIEQEKISRELFIIRSLSDTTKISQDGLVIHLGFDITSLDKERSVNRVGRLKEYFEGRKVKIKNNDA